MAASLHGSARATPRVRAELQRSQEATHALATRYGSNPNTVQKWRKRTTTANQPMGPSRPCRAVLTEVKKAIVTKFRRRTLLPLDNVARDACMRASQSSRTVPCTAAWSGAASHGCTPRLRAY